MRITAGFALVLGLATAAAAQTPWGYVGKDGPMNWGRLDPSYRACADGKLQSPIDIRGAKLNKGLQPLDFHFVAAPVTLENTGNLIVAHMRAGSTLSAEGALYQLQDMVFHHPSEHAVRGKLSDMDVDMVFKGGDGKMAMVTVRLSMERGEANAIVTSLWEHLPTTTGSREEVPTLINPGGLLPRDVSYWAYSGSLTTPPCTEGVRWYVMQQEISISRQQLRQFAGMFRINSRPLQDAHGRKIEAHE
jgi:carbonic anhydrase